MKNIVFSRQELSGELEIATLEYVEAKEALNSYRLTCRVVTPEHVREIRHLEHELALKESRFNSARSALQEHDRAA